MPYLPKPDACRGCALYEKGLSFASAVGPVSSPLLFVGESLGKDEAWQGVPFVGAAGAMMQRVLNLLGWDRQTIRIHNTVNCFPGDTLIRAPGLRKGIRRWYSGIVASVETRHGDLTATTNHPVLTSTGWKPLGEVQQGDYLIRTRLRQGRTGRDPDVTDVPTSLAKTFQALAKYGGCARMAGTDVDFHGDGTSTEIEVISDVGMLRDRFKSPLLEHVLQEILEPTDFKAGVLSPVGQALSAALSLLQTSGAPTDSGVSSGSDLSSILSSGAFEAESLGLSICAFLNLEERESCMDLSVPEVQAAFDRFCALSTQVELSEVVGVTFSQFSGHVYNLETDSHKYTANGYIVHNCQPPGDWLEGAPWQHNAIACCAPYLEASLNNPAVKVVVPLGGVALRRVMHLTQKKVRVQDFHGSILREPQDRFWVVPTYHFSYLQRGATNLIGTVLFDLRQAESARQHGRPTDQGVLIIDPPIDWFRVWVTNVLAAHASDPGAYPLSVDIETPDKISGKDEGEITADDRSYIILRVNLSCNPDEGITVPFIGPYIDELTRLFAGGMPLWLWNKAYDIPRLVQAETLDGGVDARALDLMWLWHILQSDLPRGLGFVAPFYSGYGPWKHLADENPGLYGAVDGLQTHRVGFGVTADLQRLGLWDTALRHVHRVYHLALKPAQDVGVRIDRDRLMAFKAELAEKAITSLDRIQACIPEAILPLTPKQGLVHRPLGEVLHVKASAFTRKGKKRAGREASEIKQDLYKKARIIERTVEKEIFVCTTCGARDVPRRHACADKTCAPGVELERGEVVRYFWQEPFNPDSPPQVLSYIKHRKHQPGRAKKTQKDSTNRETLERLVRTGDPFYPALLDYRAIMKVKGTYVDGTERRLDEEDRIHPEPTFKPSTHRLSYVNPNITNVVADKGGKASLAAGFRRCVVPLPSTRFLEVDFSGSEAVDFGWFCRDPNYIRLAALGVHAGLASYILGRPYNPTWTDAELGGYFKGIKKSPDQRIKSVYDGSKRFVHGYSYGLTIAGMTLQFPEFFPTHKIAQKYADLFNTMAPKAGPFQRAVRERAFKQHYLGGSDHPFGYKHWFWSVFSYKRITISQYYAIIQKYRALGVAEEEAPVAMINGTPFRVSLGEDGKRVVAFYPQSTTAGKLKEVMLRLFDPESPSYIGEACFGKTPLRAPIHDSLLLEVPVKTFDLVASIVFREMQRPFTQMPMPEEWGLGPYLATGVSAKTGKPGASWGEMEDLDVPTFSELGVGSDVMIVSAEPEEQEDVDDLAREIA